MPAPFIIPFNFQPISTSIKTSAYTVPAGKYAEIKQIRTRLYLDGVLLNNIESGNTVASGSGATARRDLSPLSSKEYGIYFQDIAAIRAASSGSLANSFSIVDYTMVLAASEVLTTLFSTSRTSNGTTAGASFWYPATMFYSTTATTAGAGTMQMNYNYIYGAVTDSFWVTSGAVLDGEKYMVTEYNQIS